MGKEKAERDKGKTLRDGKARKRRFCDDKEKKC